MNVSGAASRRAGIALAAAIAMATATACGSDDDSSTSTSAAAATDTATTAEEAGGQVGNVLTMDELYAGYESEPPTEGPPAAKGKSVWWISCGQQIPDCAEPAAAAKEAAATLGLDFDIADGALNVGGGFEKAIRQAVAAGADALILQGSVGCTSANQALKEAVDAGVELMGIESLDCDDPPTNGQGLYTAEMKYSDKAPTVVDYEHSQGGFGAAYLVNALDGEAKVINEAGGGDPIYVNINDGFVAMMDECASCEITESIEFQPTDLTPDGPLAQRFRTALVQAPPDLNGVYMPFDVNVVGVGGAKDVQESGRELVGAGGLGTAAGLDLIRQGRWDAATARDGNWMAYAAIDNINRVLNGEDTVTQGFGVRIVDADHNLPPEGENYQSPIDWKAAYEAMWTKANGG